MGLLHSIRVEAIGDASAASATNKLYRWTYNRGFLAAPSTTDPDELYKTDSLLFWPSELSSSVDFLGGVVRGSAQTFRLRGYGEVWTSFYRLSPLRVAFLEADLTAAGESITLDTSGLTGTIYLEREAIQLGTETSSKVYDCTRGVLETSARPHSASLTADRAVYSTPPVLEGRVVQLVQTQHNAGAYVETVLWSGVLREISTVDAGATIEIQCDDLLSLARGKALFAEVARGKCSRIFWNGFPASAIAKVDGPASIPFASGSQATGDNVKALALFEGAYCDNATVLSGSDVALDVLLDLGDPPYGQGASFPVDSNEALLQVQVSEVFSSRSDAPSNYDSPGVDTLPLRQDPGELTLQLLTTTKNAAQKGPNGDYDTGVRALAGSIDASLVDTSQILGWSRGLGFSFESLFLGLEESSRGLLDVLKDLHKGALSVLAQSRAGKLYIARLDDLEVFGSSSTLTSGNILSVGYGQARNLPEALDHVELTFNARPGVEPDLVRAQDSIKYSRQILGESDTFSSPLPGIADDVLAQSIAQTVIQRFHDPIPIIELETNSLETFELGDLVNLTESHLFNKDGTRGGGTPHKLLVISRQERFSFSSHTIAYAFLDVGLVHNRDGWIAPSARIASVSTADITCEANDFTATYAAAPGDPLGTGSSRVDVDGFFAGDVLDCVDETGALVEVVTVQSVTRGSNLITLTSTPSATFNAGYILRPTSWTNCSTEQQDRWIFVAQLDELLPDDSLPYTYRA